MIAQLREIGIQPRFLKRAQAAAYVGVSVSTFDTEVSKGMWPRAVRRGAKDDALTWDRKALDAAADRLAGLTAPAPDAPMPSGLEAAEAAALEAARRGSTKRDRRSSGQAHTR